MVTAPHFIDTHCHLNFERYDQDRAQVVRQAAEAGVTRIIIPAVDLQSAQEAITLSQQHVGIFAAVGVHPNSTLGFNEETIQRIDALSRHDKVIAIGEIGLDYHWDKSPKATQQDAFEAQLTLASQRELPIIIHNREASEDVMAILEVWSASAPDSLKGRLGVMHSFSAPPQVAERALAIGLYLGFTGPITFKKADELRQIARTVPLERLLVETDSPFLTPHPYRGKRNSPEYIPLIADTLAGLHGLTLDEMAEQTTRNAMRLFALAD